MKDTVYYGTLEGWSGLVGHIVPESPIPKLCAGEGDSVRAHKDDFLFLPAYDGQRVAFSLRRVDGTGDKIATHIIPQS